MWPGEIGAGIECEIEIELDQGHDTAERGREDADGEAEETKNKGEGRTTRTMARKRTVARGVSGWRQYKRPQKLMGMMVAMSSGAEGALYRRGSGGGTERKSVGKAEGPRRRYSTDRNAGDAETDGRGTRACGSALGVWSLHGTGRQLYILMYRGVETT